MKRIISVILTIAVLIAVCNVSYAAEKEETVPALTLAAETAGGTPGGTITVTLSLTSNPGFMFLRITPQYDENVLTPVSVSKTGAEVIYDSLSYSKNIVIDNSEDVTGTGKLATMTFSVAENADPGTTEINFEIKECFNEAEDEVPFVSASVSAQIAYMSVSLGSGEGVLGGTVEITVSVANNPGFCYMELSLTLPEHLTLGSVVANSQELKCSSGTRAIIEKEDGDFTGNGVIATLIFNVAEHAPRGTFEIAAELTGLFNYAEDSVACLTVTPGSATLTCDHHSTEIRDAAAPTCTGHGYTGDEYCLLCGDLVQAGEDVAPAGHSYGEPTFEWATDYSSATATFACTICGDTETEPATVGSETTAPTCEEAGETRYTATVTFEGEVYSDVKTVTIQPNGHSYGEPVFVWNGDHSAATATFTCPVCGDVQNVSATVTVLSSEPTCSEKGYKKYTATVEFEGETYSDSVTFEIAPKGHSYGCVFVWSEDNTSATAKFTCAFCGDVQNVEATVTEVNKTVRDSTGAFSVSEYTATAVFEDETYTEKKEVVLFMYGDCNGDGRVNGQDLIRLRRYLNGETVVLYPGANANGTGIVNGQDLIRLRKYLASDDISLLGPQ